MKFLKHMLTFNPARIVYYSSIIHCSLFLDEEAKRDLDAIFFVGIFMDF